MLTNRYDRLPLNIKFNFQRFVDVAATNYAGHNLNKNNFHTSNIANFPERLSIRIGNNLSSRTLTVDEQLQERSQLIATKLQQLEDSKIQHIDKYGSDLDYKAEMSSYGESFPWFVDSEGRLIDFNQEVQLVDSIKLVTRFLETKLGINKSEISEVKLTENIESLLENENLTVLTLFEKVKDLYDSSADKNIFKEIQNSNNPSEANSAVESLNIQRTNSQPFGAALAGQTTLNEIAVKFQNLQWGWTIDNVNFTINACISSYFSFFH